MPELLRAGDGFGRLGVGVPYFKASYLFFRWWSWMLVGGFEEGDELLMGPEMPGEVPIPMAHNALVEAFLATDCDTLCIVEDDQVGDQDVVRRMRNKPQNCDFDIVCASYVNRRGLPIPMGWTLGPEQGKSGYQCVFAFEQIALDGETQEYDGAALGLVLIRRWVLEAMARADGGDPNKFFWFEWRGYSSQDVDFYAKAHAVGARVGVDRDNWIGHVGQYVWTKEDFVKWQAKRRALLDVQNGPGQIR